VKWLSRLPVTEEITGSNPAGPAKKRVPAKLGLFSWADLSAIGTGDRVSIANGPVRGAKPSAGIHSEPSFVKKDEVCYSGRARQKKRPILADRSLLFMYVFQLATLTVN
jgi:hypothetical protein